MKKIFTLVVIGVLLTACSPGKQETAVADTTLVSMQDTILNDQSVVSEEVVKETAAPLTAQTFESLPSELQEFMSAVQDMDKLAGWLHTAAGCYLIEEGPGIYPIVTELKTSDDFVANSEFMLFMNTSRPAGQYYVNQNVSICNLGEEGVYFSEVSTNNHILRSAYESHLAASGETLSDELRTKPDALDAALTWKVIINLPNKTGDLNTFEVYLASVDNKPCIAVIDTRGYGL
ncbi:MAG: hypothetical protein E6Q41_00450 [Cyclobacteriaceae bacterium]|nr:MAG: hypothetical protein E6Q41_00450 [Cyclobacteriaceae bacterium]